MGGGIFGAYSDFVYMRLFLYLCAVKMDEIVSFVKAYAVSFGFLIIAEDYAMKYNT